MPTPIEFYFDFSSPYGYFGSVLIDELANKHDRETLWRPYLMGAALKVSGRQPLVNQKLVQDYAFIDVPRTARLHNIQINWPDKFPVLTVAACRAYYWLLDDDSDLARHFALAVYKGYFVDGIDISNTAKIAEIGVSLGIDQTAIENALQDQRIKDRVRAETDSAIERKIFGSPYFIVDNEPFWGVDRLDQLDHWISSGGW